MLSKSEERKVVFVLSKLIRETKGSMYVKQMNPRNERYRYRKGYRLAGAVKLPSSNIYRARKVDMFRSSFAGRLTIDKSGILNSILYLTFCPIFKSSHHKSTPPLTDTTSSLSKAPSRHV